MSSTPPLPSLPRLLLLATLAACCAASRAERISEDSTSDPAERFRPWREAANAPSRARAYAAWTTRVRGPASGEGAWRAFDTAIETASGPTSGRISALRFGPGVSGARTMWIGTSSGGLYQRDDAASRWVPSSTDLVGSPSVGDLAFADALVLATGDPWRYPGTGIYRREAQGWSIAAMPQVPSSVYRLAVDRGDPQRLFAATPQGLWRSGDGGRTWQAHVAGHFTDVVQDPAVATRWYAGAFDAGVLRSTDGGASFAPANGGTIIGAIGRVSLATSAAQAGLVFALVADGGNTRGVFRSTDAATTWSTIDGGPDTGWGQAFHTNAIAAHPSDASLLVVAQGGAKLTRDALAPQPTWQDIGTGHSDTTRLAWDDAGVLWATNDGGIATLDLDAGTTDRRMNDGLSTLQVFAPGALAIDANGGDRAWIGLQDNGLVRAELQPVQRLVLGTGCCDGGWVTSARNTPGRIAAMLGIPFSQYLSNNAGDTFSRFICLPEATDANSPLLFDPAPSIGSPALLYAAVQSGVTGAARLQRTNLALACAFSTQSFPIPGATGFAPEFMSIANDPGRVVLFMSPRGGASDRRYAIGRSPIGARDGTIVVERREPPLTDRLGQIAADPSRAGRVWWWTSDGPPRVMRNDAYGEDGAWVDATGDLDAFGPGLRIRRVVAHPRDDALAWLASSIGVLATEDGGAHWLPDHAGLPAVVDTVDIAIQPATTLPQPSVRLWLATYGHGLWRRELVDDRLFAHGFELP